jgi:hypothetical protein
MIDPTKHALDAQLREDAEDNRSIDQTLRDLIGESDLIEVACVLDRIAAESNRRVRVFQGDVQVYPAPPGDRPCGS